MYTNIDRIDFLGALDLLLGASDELIYRNLYRRDNYLSSAPIEKLLRDVQGTLCFVTIILDNDMVELRVTRIATFEENKEVWVTEW